MAAQPAEQFGTYLVYEQIGVGGMATVHRAETTGIAGFRKPVALKRMLPHVAANEDLVRSFVREARLASHLRHGNVAQTYDLGKVGDIYFIAMELVVGRTLREILRHCAKYSLRVPIPITLNILTQVCDALDYAHNLTDDSGQPLGIIHRDVSPSNVIVSDSGVVKLIDFGIAKASAQGMQTLSGTIKGKFGYMAPEYLMGKIDARADLFAAGIMAHELLTGLPLFQGRDDMDTLYRVKSMPIAPPSEKNPDIPHEIDSIVMTALERDPEARWQRASAMRIALATETKRLGLTLMAQQVVEWCESLFADHGFDNEHTTNKARAVPDEPDIVIERHDEDVGNETRSLRKDQVGLPSARNAPPLSGARTHLEMKRNTLHVEAEDVLAEIAVHRDPAASSAMTLPGTAGVAPTTLPGTAVTPIPRPSAPPIGAATLPGTPAASAAVAARISASLSAPLPSSAPLTIPSDPSSAESAAVTAHSAATKRMGALTIAVLLLLTAAASAAVVYFGLPYIR